jgi:hypothetical protein
MFLNVIPAGRSRLSFLEWKWDDISMDFIMGLPMTAYMFDSMWVS